MREKIDVLIDEDTVDKKIREMGALISEKYAGKTVHLICILKGGAFFTCELAKRITTDISIDFMVISSYGDDTKSSGEIKVVKDLTESIEGKNVLIVEDIIDTGRSLKKIKELLWERKPESLEICTLLDKPEGRVVEIEAEYKCFEIPNKFVVGYGLDYAQKYRNLPYIGVIEE